jgi:hypothetical protein
MATLQALIDSVDVLQSSVTTLTTEVNIRKAALTKAVLDSTQQATNSELSATDSNAAKLLSEAAKEIAIVEAGKSGTSAGQSVASAAAAAQSNLNTQTLLVNFFDLAIIALNSRIVLDGATVVIKLRFVQVQLDTL